MARYRLEEILGEGAEGTTYRATRLEDELEVAIKELPLRRAVEPQTLELLRREARTLRQLQHPAIPRYLDDFVAGEGKTRALFIVQEYINGRTLADELVDHHHGEDDVLRILEELLVILGYMHALEPPVLHRDLKPGNVMRRGSDGRLMLVDFGLARDILKDSDVGATTVAGTFGYMAPEQLRGASGSGTELYGLGALAVALLSRRRPHTLLDHAYRMRWQDRVDVSGPMAGLLADLLHRDPEQRESSADRVLARVRALRGVSAAGEAIDADPHEETMLMPAVAEDGDTTVPPWAVGPGALGTPSPGPAHRRRVQVWLVLAIAMAVAAAVVVALALT